MVSKNHHVIVIDDTPSLHDDYERILASSSVEDEEEDLDDLEAILFEEDSSDSKDGEAGPDFALEHAFSGEEGLRIVEKFKDTCNPISLAFVDMRMPPGWDGAETIEHLWKADPRLQVVICTAFSDIGWSDLRSRFGERDNLFILRKPFEPEEVQQLAVSLTEKWGQETHGKTIFTVAPEYPLRIVEVKPAMVTEKALVYNEFVTLPDGKNQKVFLRDCDSAPTSPSKALHLFVENQVEVVEELTKKLSIESGKLNQARKFLEKVEAGSDFAEILSRH